MTALSPDTIDWVYDYMNDWHGSDNSGPCEVTASVTADLAPYKPRESVTLYRGIAHHIPTGPCTTTYRTTFTSWSRDPYVSAGYAEDGILLMATIPPESILVDVEELRRRGLMYVPADEKEMIVYPGTYNVVRLDLAAYE